MVLNLLLSNPRADLVCKPHFPWLPPKKIGSHKALLNLKIQISFFDSGQNYGGILGLVKLLMQDAMAKSHQVNFLYFHLHRASLSLLPRQQHGSAELASLAYASIG